MAASTPALALAILLAAPPLSQDEISAWIERLGAEFAHERAEARAKLAQAGDAAVEPLIAAVYRDDPYIRAGAIGLLTARLDAARAARPPWLRRATEAAGWVYLRESDRETRLLAFSFLLKAGEPAEPYLIEALRAQAWWERTAAVGALQRIGSRAALPEVTRLFEAPQVDSEFRTKAFDYFASCGADGYAYLIRLLSAEDAQTRSMAVERLRGVADRPTPILEALGALLRRESERAIRDQILDYLRSAVKEERTRDVATDLLIRAVREAPVETRVLALGILRDEQTDRARAVAESLIHPAAPPQVRQAAADILVALGGSGEVFRAALAHDDAGLARLCISALTRLGHRPAAPDAAAWYARLTDGAARRELLAYLSEAAAKETLDTLVQATGDEDPEVRRLAVAGLANVGTPRAVAHILRALYSDDTVLRAEAERHIARLRSEQLAEVLRLLPEDVADEDRRRVREQYFLALAEETISRYVTQSAQLGAYRGMLAEVDSQEREPMREALRAILEENYSFRIEPVGDPAVFHHSMKQGAILALARIAEEQDLERLRTLATPGENGWDEYHQPMMSAAAVALAWRGDRTAANTLAARLEQIAQDVRERDPLTWWRASLERAWLLHRIGDWEAAAEAYAALQAADAEEYPDRAVLWYNSACVAAQRGRLDEAMEFLRRALDKGFADPGWVERDEELLPLRGREDFRALVEQLKAG
jgi:HEAT repeat protein